MRFVKNTAVTNDGEIAEKKVYEIDEEQIAKNLLYIIGSTNLKKLIQMKKWWLIRCRSKSRVNY